MTADPARKIDVFGGGNGVRVQPKELDEAKQIVVQADELRPLEPYDETGKKAVSNVIRNARDMIKMIKEHHDPIKRAAKRTHEVACQKEKDALKPVQEALDKAQGLLNSVTNKERLLEQQKREKAEQEAREQAQKRREAAEAMMAELLEKAETTAGQIKLLEEALEDDATTEDEAAVIRRKITILQAQIDNDEQALAEAQYKTEEPVFVPQVEEQKVEGISKGEKVTVEVKSMRELCAAIGRGEVAPAAVKPMQGKLNSYARDGVKLPGCVIHREAKATVR